MKKILAPLTVIAVLSAGAATAESVTPMNADMAGALSAKVYPLAEGHVIIDHHATYTLDFDGDTPFDGTPGECFGSMSVSNGTPTGGGHCVWDAGSGNTMVTDWRVTGFNKDGASVGIWSIVSTGGKFSGWSGGGSYISAADADSGKVSLNVTGAASR